MATTSPLLNHPSPKKPTSSSPFCLFLSFFAIIFPIALLSFYFINHTTVSHDHSSSSSLPSHLCQHSHNPTSCLSMLSEAVQDHNDQAVNDLKDIEILNLFLSHSISHISKSIKLAQYLRSTTNDAPNEQLALADCVELMSSSIDRIIDSIATLQVSSSSSRSLLDAHTWLSAVLTNHVTCLDGLHGSSRFFMVSELDDLIARARTSLAVLTSTASYSSNPAHDDLVMPLLNEDQFPSWVTLRDRKLLAAQPKDVKPNVVVAKDGSGNYKSLQDAINSAPDKSKTRYVILVKKGIYEENVEVGKKKKNIMIVGEGMDSTIVTGSRSVVDGSTTFNSATLAAVGDGFIMQDIWVQNTAGPEKHQAVALRVGADQSVINRCKIDAFQDTLYTHSLRQFYRDCDITGTVDFIFGNAAVVFQFCKLIPRKPMKGQGNMVTAQGRTDPNQNTGISIQKCSIVASEDLEPVMSSFKSYLGRPWKEYSRTVVMESNIGNVIDPAGWSIWNGDFALKTLYYGEYMNQGPGAGTSKRVNWPGYHVITEPEEAMKFTVAQLIQGGEWLKSSGVAYVEGL